MQLILHAAHLNGLEAFIPIGNSRNAHIIKFNFSYLSEFVSQLLGKNVPNSVQFSPTVHSLLQRATDVLTRAGTRHGQHLPKFAGAHGLTWLQQHIGRMILHLHQRRSILRSVIIEFHLRLFRMQQLLVMVFKMNNEQAIATEGMP